MNGTLYNHWDCAGPCFTCADTCICDRTCSGLPLTLADRELITGRSIRSVDEDGKWFCADCLADLPFAPLRQSAHVCGVPEPAPEPLPAALVALLPEDPAHKTATTAPSGYLYDADGTRRADKRGRLMRDPGSWAKCACGWAVAEDTREQARWRVRDHRREKAVELAEQNGLAERLRDMPAERVAAMIAAGKVA